MIERVKITGTDWICLWLAEIALMLAMIAFVFGLHLKHISDALDRAYPKPAEQAEVKR